MDINSFLDAKPAPDHIDSFLGEAQPPAPQSALSYIGEQAKPLFYGGVKAAGETVQGATDIAGQAPGVISGIGKSLEEYGTEGEKNVDQAALTSQQNPLTTAVGKGVKAVSGAVGGMLPIVAGMGVGGAVGAATGTAVPVPVIGTVGGGAIGAALGGGTAAGLQKYHQAYREAIDVKKLPEQEARDYAQESALKEGALMALFPAVSKGVGLASDVGLAVLGKTTPAALEAATDVLSKKFGSEAVGGTLNMMATNQIIGEASAAGQAPINQKYGVGDQESAWDALKTAALPTAEGSLAFIPLSLLHAHGVVRTSNTIKNALNDGEASDADRLNAVAAVAKSVSNVSPDASTQFILNAREAIKNGKPIVIDEDIFKPAVKPPAPTPEAATEATEPLAPAPETAPAKPAPDIATEPLQAAVSESTHEFPTAIEEHTKVVEGNAVEPIKAVSEKAIAADEAKQKEREDASKKSSATQVAEQPVGTQGDGRPGGERVEPSVEGTPPAAKGKAATEAGDKATAKQAVEEIGAANKIANDTLQSKPTRKAAKAKADAAKSVLDALADKAKAQKDADKAEAMRLAESERQPQEKVNVQKAAEETAQAEPKSAEQPPKPATTVATGKREANTGSAKDAGSVTPATLNLHPTDKQSVMIGGADAAKVAEIVSEINKKEKIKHSAIIAKKETEAKADGAVVNKKDIPDMVKLTASSRDASGNVKVTSSAKEISSVHTNVLYKKLGIDKPVEEPKAAPSAEDAALRKRAEELGLGNAKMAKPELLKTAIANKLEANAQSESDRLKIIASKNPSGKNIDALIAANKELYAIKAAKPGTPKVKAEKVAQVKPVVDDRYPASPSGSEKTGYKIIGGNEYTAEERVAHAVKQRELLKNESRILTTTASSAPNTGSRFEVRNNKALKAATLAKNKLLIAAWDKEIATQQAKTGEVKHEENKGTDVKPNAGAAKAGDQTGSTAAVGETASGKEVTHAGAKIYQTTSRGEPYWAVQDEENIGKARQFGDTLHKTLAEAKLAAEMQARRIADKAQRYKVAAEEEAKAEAKKEVNRGRSITERKTEATLDKPTMLPVNAGLGRGTRRESMASAVEQERHIVAKDVHDPAAYKRDEDEQGRLHRAGYGAFFGNDSHPQKMRFNELSAKLKNRDNYQKKEYRVFSGRDDKGGFYTIGKTDYDYAKKLEAERDSNKLQEPNEFAPKTKYETDELAARVLEKSKGHVDEYAANALARKIANRDGKKIVDGSAMAEAIQELRAKSKPEAVHKEEGKPAEPATPDVVAKSLSKGDANSKLTMAQIKERLAGKLDKAISKIKSSAEYVGIENKEFADKQVHKNDAAEQSRNNPLENHIEFDVPGDGKFKVLNSVKNLEQFRDRMSALPNKPTATRLYYENPTLSRSSAKIKPEDYIASALKDKHATAEDFQNAIEVARMHNIDDAELVKRHGEQAIREATYESQQAEHVQEEKTIPRRTPDEQDNTYHYSSGDMGMTSNGSFTKDKSRWMTFTRSEAERMDADNIKPHGAIKRGIFVGEESGEKLRLAEKPGVAENIGRDAAAPQPKEPWQMTSSEYAQNALDNNEYKKSYERDAELKEQYLKEQLTPWRRAVEKAGEANVISDRVLDDYAEKVGVQALHSAFRGVAEKGASQWEPSDVRVWDKTYAQFLKHHAGLTVNGNKKDSHRQSIRRALEQGKPVPANVLADYPDLKPSQEPKAGQASTANDAPQSSAFGLKEVKDALAKYGAEVNEDGYITRKGRVLHVKPEFSKQRLRFVGDNGKALFSGGLNEKTVSGFVEDYWKWEKPPQASKPSQEAKPSFEEALDDAYENGFGIGDPSVVRSKQDMEEEYGALTDDRVDQLRKAYQDGVAEGIAAEHGGGFTKKPSQEPKAEQTLSPLDKLDEPPHQNYRVQETSSNAANILPPVGKKFTPEERDGLRAWLKAAGFSVQEKPSGFLWAIGDGAPNIPDGLREKRIAISAEKSKIADEAYAEKTKAHNEEYAQYPSSKWIDGHVGKSANDFNKLQVARFLEGGKFNGLLGGWHTALERMGFDVSKPDVTVNDALDFIKRKYQESKAEQAAITPGMSTRSNEEVLGHLVRDKIISAPSFQKLLAAAKSHIKSIYRKVADDYEAKIMERPWELLGEHAGVLNAKSARATTLRGLADAVIREAKLPMQPSGNYRGMEYNINWDKVAKEQASGEGAPQVKQSIGQDRLNNRDEQIRLLQDKFTTTRADAELMFREGKRIDPKTGDFYGADTMYSRGVKNNEEKKSVGATETNESNREYTEKLQSAMRQQGNDFTITPVQSPALHESKVENGGGKQGNSDIHGIRGASVRPAEMRVNKANEELFRQSSQLAERVAGIFGKDIVWIKAEGGHLMQGAMVPGMMPDKIFINIKSPVPAHAVMGHELSHHMEVDAPAVYAKLVTSISRLLKNNDAYAKKYGIENYSKEDITKEMVGDIVGDSFSHPNFWKDLAKINPESVRNIGDTVVAWMNKILKKIGRIAGFNSSEFVTDIHDARRAVAEAVGKYALNRKGARENDANELYQDAYGKPKYSITPSDRLKTASDRIKATEAVKSTSEAWDGIQRLVMPQERDINAKEASRIMIEGLGEKEYKNEQFRMSLEKSVVKNNKNLTMAQKFRDTIEKGLTVAADRLFVGKKDESYAFMQAMGTQDKVASDAYFSANPHMKGIGDVIHKMFLAKAKEVQELSTGALDNLRDNYFPGMWKDKISENAQKQILSALSKQPLEGSKAFTKGKVFEDFNEGIKLGYEPISDNPLDIVALKMEEMDKYILAHKTLRALEKTDSVKLVAAGEKIPRGFTEINGHYGYIDRDIGNGVQKYRYVADDSVAQVINNYLSPSLYNNKYIGKPFTAYMGTANLLNQFQLGISAFHAGFTSLESVISHGALGFKSISEGKYKDAAKYLVQAPAAWITNPRSGSKILQEWLSKGSHPEMASIIEGLQMAGARRTMDQRFRTDSTKKMIENWQNGNKTMAAIHSVPAFIEQTARPILEWLVPRQKFGVFGEMYSKWMKDNPKATHEELRNSAQQIWNRVDSRLGQVVYDRMFMHNTTKNIAQMLIRAPGWTGGTIIEVGGGFKDLAKYTKDLSTGKKPAGISDRAAYVLSMITTTAIANSLLTLAFTGQSPQDWKDMFAFRTGNLDEKGRPERFMLPTYAKDLYAYSQAPFTTLSHKTHPLLSLGSDVLNNRDYYGTQIRSEDDNLFTQLAQTAGYGAKAFIPFWIKGAQKESERGGTALSMAAPLIGVMPASSDINKTKAEKLMGEYGAERVQQGTRTQEEEKKKEAKDAIYASLRRGDKDKARELFNAAKNEGILVPKDFRAELKAAHTDPLIRSFQKLTYAQAKRVMEAANDEEKKKLAMPMLRKQMAERRNHPMVAQNIQ